MGLERGTDGERIRLGGPHEGAHKVQAGKDKNIGSQLKIPRARDPQRWGQQSSQAVII